MKEKKTVFKLFFVWDFEKEERWLNEMAREGWVHFRRKTELGSFELLSDIDSRLTHLSRIDRMLSLICLANLILGITNSLNQARCGWLNLLCAAMLSYALGRIHGMKAALEKERSLHE